MLGAHAVGGSAAAGDADHEDPGGSDHGKPFPDGAKMAKVHWRPKKLEALPTAMVPASPQANHAKCGLACHTIVKARDYVFTDYGKR